MVSRMAVSKTPKQARQGELDISYGIQYNGLFFTEINKQFTP